MNKSTLIVAALFGCLLTSGCVAGRRTVSLPVTQLPATGTSKGSIYIGAIEDRRTFENKPSAPSTPSIDGDVTLASKDQLATMIGRQRNTYGHAMGDIALPEGDSVLIRTRALLEEGLKRRGYAISTDSASPNTATATINDFWAWFTPGMWSVSFEANVACKITVTRAGAATTITVEGHGKNQGQVASDANWQLAYQRAFDDFLTNLNTELGKAGL
jgi:Uncharacterized lipoprotein